MNRNMILKTDILDIIFEKRNKLYGAYDLRKFYQHRLKLALAAMFITAALFSGFTMMPEKNKIAGPIYTPPEPTLKEVEIPKDPQKKPEVPKRETKPAVKPMSVNQKRFISNIVVAPKNTKTDSIFKVEPTDVIGPQTIVNADPGPFLPQPVKPEPGNGGGEKSIVKIDNTTPMEGNEVDVLPSYPGGMEAFRAFMQKNLQTPGELEEGQTVSVRIKFVVDNNGKLKSFATVLDGGDAYNKEVLRVLKKMPDWIPGKAKGENVSVYHIIPVKFVPAD